MTEIRDRLEAAPATTTTILSGVEALARLLVVRHELDERRGLTTATMVSGYPGSPLGTFDLTLERNEALLTAHRVVHRPGLNEELAAAIVWGSQMGGVVPYAGVDGVAGAWYGKGPGLDRSGDALKHANAMGAGPNGGAVVFCGDDPSAKSSTLPCDSQYTFEDACMPVLYPGDQQDIIDLGVHAFAMSRYSGAWVGLKIVTSVADGIGSVDIDAGRHDPRDPTDFLVDGEPWVHHPLHTIGPHQIPSQEVLVVEHRLRAAQAYARRNGIDRVVGAGPGAPLGVVCAGKTYFDVVQALGDLGYALHDLESAGVRILKLAMTYPIVPEIVREFASSVDTVLVIEEKRPFVETQLRGVLHEAGIRTPVLGKRDRDGNVLASQVGELDATAVRDVLVRVAPTLAPVVDEPAAPTRLPLLQLPGRAPAFCSGCPHNRSTIFPDDALVGGGVGCHGIMYFEARHRGMKSMPPTPMGAEGVPWIGLAPFVDEPHLIQNLGDGTFSHSGILAIRACVAAEADITFKVLYNRAVAMTGGQDVTGLRDVPDLTRELAAEGVQQIVVCAEDPKRYGRHADWAPGVRVLARDELPEVQEQLRDVRGVTVIIYDQRCAAEARRLRKAGQLFEPPQRVVINEAVCEGCGDCSTKSNCLSVLPIDTEFGEKRRIHDSSCNRDYTCLEGDCPSFVTIEPVDPDAARAEVRPAPVPGRRAPLPLGTLPEPAVRPVDGQFGVYFTGIGGTGVVTAVRIIATAGEDAGFLVGGMDQTGLSQKAGAVASHLHLATDREALGAAAVGNAGADLYLSGDILQAASAAHLGRVDPGTTIAVIDRDVTPTAAMLQTDTPPPDLALLEETIAARVGADRTVFVDAQQIAERLLGNHVLANVVLLGAAFQAGGLPVGLAGIEDAIATMGRSAAENREAFEWGRWVVHDRAAVDRALDAAARAASGSIWDPSPDAERVAAELVGRRPLPDALHDLLVRRAAQVVDYQHRALAERYLALVQRTAVADDAAHDWALTRAVAEAWFKVLTYKDEYEVARLHLRVDYDRVARDLGIDGEYTVKYHLHPPMLRRLGLHEKLPLGKTYETAFKALEKMKRLRGTKLDPFGYDRDRRTERAVIAEYEQLIGEIIGPDSTLPYDTRVELAASPMEIKGYADIKERAVAAWRARVAELRARPVLASESGSS